MRDASPGLVALLNSGTQFYSADLYTFTLTGGVVQRYTGADVDLTYNGNLFGKLNVARSKTRVTVGLEVDTLDISVWPTATDTLGGYPWIGSARTGRLDGAAVKLERIFMPTWGDTSLGAINLFQGRVANVDLGRTEAKIQVKSYMELLDTQLPRNFFQSPCTNTLFDNACTLNKAFFGTPGSVSSGTQTQLTVNAGGKPVDWFTLGTIMFTSGLNINVIRSIRQDLGSNLQLSFPLPYLPAAGDSFTAYPGCDKTKTTCVNKFNNVQNIKMYPYVPSPEVAT